MSRIDPNVMRGAARARLILAVALAAATGAGPTAAVDQPAAGASVALFEQIASVMRHPRCLNCHSGQAFPRQGDGGEAHRFNVRRGTENRGVAALHCSGCHQSRNQATSGAPGAPGWRLAPAVMGWEGLSSGAICRALSDPARGNMTPAALVEHLRTDPLVQWAFAPGRDPHDIARTAPPMSHAGFLELMQQWRDSGAQCPD
jgi:hypothetical protein